MHEPTQQTIGRTGIGGGTEAKPATVGPAAEGRFIDERFVRFDHLVGRLTMAANSLEELRTRIMGQAPPVPSREPEKDLSGPYGDGHLGALDVLNARFENELMRLEDELDQLNRTL